MITKRTKVQLMVFALITLLGVSFVGARYARLDRVFIDDTYTVVAHFSSSGGIFAGAGVTYRGVGVGSVDKLVLTEDGVDVHLSIDDDWDEIPADSIALVGNRSAVGEQYVELQPQSDGGPFLADDAEIALDDTRTPLPTEQLLTDISETVSSVDRDALQTTVTELGAAFAGTGEDLQRIIDTGNSFIESADENFELTTALIEDGNTVLRGQADSAGALRTFARDLSLFSGALAGSDRDLRRIIENGSATAVQLRTFLEENEVDLGQLINDLVTTGEILVTHLDGVEQVLVTYPYVVEGGFTVVSKNPNSGLYDAHFGLIITTNAVCHSGYQSTDTRPPQDRDNRPMNEDARCTEPPTVSNARGAQNIGQRAGANYRAPVVASYDPETGRVRWGDRVEPELAATGSVAPRTLGEESWKWLFLEPLATTG